ncbi:two-component response regulator [Candidatus Omnitrophus magneticus]|uniref:Two-component response regulator n=1 Tax=Candidatus Omnitrophus magneticus TaxID=1609969 RepID=A0A0F0CX12_9BACT|nr:two-component response regulator [Candidatus Omnitrophus magneticus]
MTKKRILVIDDNESLLKMLKISLNNAGYESEILSDPFKAEQYIETFKPELLLIDIFMPGRSGFNIVEDFNAKGIYKKIPKIFLTGLDDDIEKMTAMGIGVTSYITKPFKIQDLIDCIKNIFLKSLGDSEKALKD